MKKLINEAFRLQQLAGIQSINSLNEEIGEEKNYVMYIQPGDNQEEAEYKVLGKVGEFDIENYLNKFIDQKKAEYMQDDDSDSGYAEEFFNWSKEDLYGKGEMYQGQFGEEEIFDIYEIPADVTDFSKWISDNINEESHSEPKPKLEAEIPMNGTPWKYVPQEKEAIISFLTKFIRAAEVIRSKKLHDEFNNLSPKAQDAVFQQLESRKLMNMLPSEYKITGDLS